MNRFFTILTFLIFPLSGFATEQIGDILIWKGDTLKLYSNPLEQYPGIDSLRFKMFGDKEKGFSTACGRGYIAEWSIINKELYLTNIYSCNYYEDGLKANLSVLFQNEFKNSKVKASWVNGQLVIPKGKLILHTGDVNGSIYESEIGLLIQKGVLIDQKAYDNSKSYKSVYTENLDSLQKFIYANIDWDKIPNLGDEKVKVFVSLKSGKSNKPDSIKILRKATLEICNEESLRVMELIPDWSIYYRMGKVYKMRWVIPVIFDEEKRKKYSG